MAAESAPTWLKVLVVVLGLAIIGMLALIIYKVMAGDADEPKIQLPPVSEAPFPTGDLVQIPDTLTLELPAGSEVISVAPHGREIYFRVRAVSGSEQVFILDRLTGAVSRIEITVGDT